MTVSEAVVALWDIPGREKEETPLALRSVAGLPLLTRALRALSGASVKKIYIASNLSEARLRPLIKENNITGVQFILTRGVSAAGAFALAAKKVNASSLVLMMDGLCPGADAMFLKRLLRARPSEPLIATGCGDDCGDEHAAIARVSAKLFKKIFSGSAAPRGLSEWLRRLEEVQETLPIFEAPFYEDLPVRDLGGLADAARVLRLKIIRRHLSRGVEVMDPENTWIDETVTLGRGTVILPYSFLNGDTRVGKNCVVGPFARLRDCVLADDCRFEQSTAENSRLRTGASVGPWSRLRAGSEVGSGAKLGNFCEFKNAQLASGVKAGHLSYLGDVSVGANSNIGAGTITANYDGKRKHKTKIGAQVFTGSNTVLVAPISLGAKVKTGAGSVLLAKRNIPKGKTAVGAPARILSKKGK